MALTAGSANFGIGERRGFIFGQRAQTFGIIKRGHPQVGTQCILNDLGITLVASSSPHLGGASNFGIEIDRDLALGSCHGMMVSHDAMALKGNAEQTVPHRDES